MIEPPAQPSPWCDPPPCLLPACACSSQRTVEVPAAAADGGQPFYSSTGVEKAVALARYSDLMHTWLLDQWKLVDPQEPPYLIPQPFCDVFPAWYCPVPAATWGPAPADGGCTLDRWLLPGGCILPPPAPIWVPLLGRWERQSAPLAVNPDAKQAIEKFLPYFEQVGWLVYFGKLVPPLAQLCGGAQPASRRAAGRADPATSPGATAAPGYRQWRRWATPTCSRRWS